MTTDKQDKTNRPSTVSNRSSKAFVLESWPTELQSQGEVFIVRIGRTHCMNGGRQTHPKYNRKFSQFNIPSMPMASSLV